MDNNNLKKSSYKQTRKNGYGIIIAHDKFLYQAHAEVLAAININPIHANPQENVQDLFSIPNLQTQTDIIIDLSLFDLTPDNFQTLTYLLSSLITESAPKVVIVSPLSLFDGLPKIEAQIQKIHNLNCRLLITDTVYTDHSTPNSLFSSPKNKTTSQEFSIAPIHIVDYAKFLTKTLLNPNTQGQTFFIAGKKNNFKISPSQKKLSERELDQLQIQADILSKINQTQKYLNYQPTINFPIVNQKTSPNTPKIPKKQPTTKKSYDNYFLSLTKKLFTKTQVKYNLLHKIARKTLKYTFLSLALLITIAVIFSCITTYLIYSSYQDIKQGKLQTSIAKSTQATHNLTFARASLRIIPSTLISNSIFIADSFLETVQISSRLLTQTTTLVQEFQSIPSYQSLDQSQINNLKNNLTTINQQLSYLQPKLPQQLPHFFSPLINGNDYDQFYSLLVQSRQIIPVVNDLLGQINYVGGFDKPREIIILLQNNNELRATGGFIGSFAHLTLSRGVINNWKIYDVYDADGQLQGYVRPPEPIKNILNEPSWYLRDSNWEPDFPTSANNASWFLNKELTFTPDIIIALNLSYIEKILKPLTPLNNQGVEEQITSQNLHNIFQTNIEDNFYPSSNLKKTLITDLATKLINNYQSTDIKLLGSLASQTLSDLNSREIQVFSTNDNLQNKLGQYNWTGHLLAPVPNQSSATIAIVDSNLGVNKANQFIKRNLSIQIRDDPNLQTINLTAQYTNSSQSQTKQSGDYKNYLRVYLPPDAVVQSVSITDQNQDTQAVDPEIDIQKNFLQLGIYFPLSIQTQSQINIVFTTQKLTQPNSSLTIRKQSGTQDDEITFQIDSPRNLILSTPFPLQPVSSLTLTPHVPYNTVLSTDKLIIFN